MDYVETFMDDTLFEAYLAEVLEVKPSNLKGLGRHYSGRVTYDITPLSPPSVDHGYEVAGDQFYDIWIQSMMEMISDNPKIAMNIVDEWRNAR